MMRRKPNIIVGLTTFNNEMLRISVPALGKIRQKFTLIVHNDNPMTTVSRRQIRKLGYCGDLQIINANRRQCTESLWIWGKSHKLRIANISIAEQMVLEPGAQHICNIMQ